jgi:pSer/pThr/pTyr-binding forkhead associated (FHA) protein
MDELTGLVLLLLRIGLMISLYAFLAGGLFLIWQDLNKQSAQRAARHLPPLSLELLHALDNPSKQRYTRPQVFIGRDPGCDCHIANDTVSSQHARLYYDQNQWWVEDHHSKNGTFLNEEQVLIPTVLTGGDEIRCGEVSFRVEFDD